MTAEIDSVGDKDAFANHVWLTYALPAKIDLKIWIEKCGGCPCALANGFTNIFTDSYIQISHFKARREKVFPFNY